MLRVRLAQVAHSPRGVHALLKCCEAAICAAIVETAVNCTPRIVLGFGPRADAEQGDTKKHGCHSRAGYRKRRLETASTVARLIAAINRGQSL
jgi:hypothetical protein